MLIKKILNHLFISIIVLLTLQSCNTISNHKTGINSENYIILISFDGFRWDYMDKTDTPNLDRLVANGVKADAMIPCFPSKTFPNHYAIVTGLYPENHGIIANNMYDPEFDATFSLGNREEVQNGRWWGGEPIWVTAENQGLKTLCNFWPGSEAEIKDTRPTYWTEYDGSVPNEDRVDLVLQYLDKPQTERPHLLTIYFSDPDDYGHMVGPDSSAINIAIQECDARIGQLITGLEERNMFDKVNILIVSDHGMARLSRDRVIFLDDYLDPINLNILNWYPVLDIWCEESEIDSIYSLIHDKNEHLTAYKKEDVPEYLHYSNNRRIAPIIGILDNGWSLTSREYFEENQSYFNGGTHGYDPLQPDMHAFFLGHGPAFKNGVTIPAFENIHIYNLMTEILDIEPVVTDGNISVFNEVLK